MAQNAIVDNFFVVAFIVMPFPTTNESYQN